MAPTKKAIVYEYCIYFLYYIRFMASNSAIVKSFEFESRILNFKSFYQNILLAILRAYFLNLRKCGKARAIGVYSNSGQTSYK